MKKLAIVIAGVFVAAVCSSLLAQDIVDMHANIPFDFRMGDKLVPSGTYLVQASGGAIVVREEGGRLVAAALMTIPASRGTPPDRGELVFNRYGNEYFLSSVWTPYSKEGHSLAPTKHEKDIASLASVVVERASIKTN
jgi:hypothetical protein